MTTPKPRAVDVFWFFEGVWGGTFGGGGGGVWGLKVADQGQKVVKIGWDRLKRPWHPGPPQGPFWDPSRTPLRAAETPLKPARSLLYTLNPKP